MLPAKSAGVTGDEQTQAGRPPCDWGMEGTEGASVQAHYQVDCTVKNTKITRGKNQILTLPGPVCPLDKSQFKSPLWF